MKRLLAQIGITYFSVLAEGDAQEREDLIYLEKLPLFNPDGTVKE